MERKKILAIIGSASQNSANEKLIKYLEAETKQIFSVTIFNDLRGIPHFNPEQSTTQPPKSVLAFRQLVHQAEAVIICSPEYIFSIPSGLKNAIEWCVATTLFSDKPVGLITASADGERAHKELRLIMETLTAKFARENTLLIKGIKSRFKGDEIIDPQTKLQLNTFIKALEGLIG